MRNVSIKSKGAIWNLLGSTAFGLNSFIMLTLVNRFTTVADTGIFGIAFTTAQILYFVGIFGIGNYQMTDYQKKYKYSEYAAVKVVSCVLMLLCCVLYSCVFKVNGREFLVLLLLTLYMMINAIGNMYQSLFFQKNRLDYSGSSLFYRTVYSLLFFCLVLAAINNLVIALVVQNLVCVIVTIYYRFKYVPIFLEYTDLVRKVKFDRLIRLMGESFPLFLSDFLINIISNLSKYGMDIYANDTKLGYYNMLFMPANVINLCSQFIFQPLLKTYSIYLEEWRIADFWKLLGKQIAIVFAFTLFCVIGAYGIGAEVLGLLYNSSFHAFRLEIVLVIVGGGLLALCRLFYYVLLLLRRQKFIFAVYFLGIILAAFITNVLVCHYNMLGAALSFIISHFCILILFIGFTLFSLKDKGKEKR